MDRLYYLKNYYENYNEDGRLESKHGQVEFLTTVHYIEKCLQNGMKILEIGAGTGRYSHYFARNGYAVDAIELIEHNIQVFKTNTLNNENITIRQGDAINLSDVESNKYDITLLLGPMYHLYKKEDKMSALSEALRVTKKNGIVFASYCNNDMTIYQFCFQKGNYFNPNYNELINTNNFKCRSTPKEVFELYRKEEIDEIMREFDTERLHYVGTDMLTKYIAEAVDNMNEKEFDAYMKYHLYICERSDMIGATNHILDIFRKK